MDERLAVRQAAQEYLQSQAHFDPAEFGVVFDDIYEVVEQRLSGPSGTDASTAGEDGLGFDASVVAGTSLSVACFIAAVFVRAALRAGTKTLAHCLLDKSEAAIVEKIGRAPEVHRVRMIVERIVQEV